MSVFFETSDFAFLSMLGIALYITGLLEHSAVLTGLIAIYAGKVSRNTDFYHNLYRTGIYIFAGFFFIILAYSWTGENPIWPLRAWFLGVILLPLKTEIARRRALLEEFLVSLRRAF